MGILDDHELAVLEAATARLIPGPEDDPGEDTPGAREAGAVAYIVGLLGALDHDPPRIYAGGPFGAARATFLPLSATTRAEWRARLDDLVAAYRVGLRRLDELAGGDFAGAPVDVQDAVLARNPVVDHLADGHLADGHDGLDRHDGHAGFTDLLFRHTIEACYSLPEYSGNAGGTMWAAVGFPGDVQPRGDDAVQVSGSDGPDPCEVTPIVAELLRLVGAAAPPPPEPAPGPR